MKTVKIFSYAILSLSLTSFALVDAGLLQNSFYDYEAGQICKDINDTNIPSEDAKKYLLKKKNEFCEALKKKSKDSSVSTVLDSLHECREIQKILILMINNDNDKLAEQIIPIAFANSVEKLLFLIFKEKYHWEKSRSDFQKELCKLFAYSNDKKTSFVLVAMQAIILNEAITLADSVLKKLEQAME